ncbi:cupin domain-containing protein [Amycolatopsis aidingensis]|uniref:cupin domain-containing protein n=1 Tax=Amycolatopsis aidingensis TaxID=2842453 RepID=UPI001C0AB696|nr:cupin domain-containing protein [Amycolatopsis aidingensis]
METSELSVAAVAELYGLEPLPVEGGLFRRTWAGPMDADGRPAGSAILALFAAEDELFSALHRLPLDEVWHFYLGDPLELLLLEPSGAARIELLGQDVLAGQRVQLTVPAGTWMGAQVAPGGRWSLCGTTMAPGFVPEDYEGGDLDTLLAAYPDAAERIRALCRSEAPLRMPRE